MAKFISCEFCGANLDFGEKCDCIKKRGRTASTGTPNRKKSCFYFTAKEVGCQAERRKSLWNLI